MKLLDQSSTLAGLTKMQANGHLVELCPNCEKQCSEEIMET